MRRSTTSIAAAVLTVAAAPPKRAGMGRGARSEAADAGSGAPGVAALLWTGTGVSTGSALATGAVVWLAYAVLWLAIEGPVLDEAAAAAPLVAGEQVYPLGHPNSVVFRHAITLLYQLAGLQWLVYPDPWWISATRNVAFLFLSAFVPFAIATACTRRPAWGHVAAALTLSEAVCSAVGVYLMWVFPGVYSNGHFGIHLAALTVVLVAAGVDRLGGALAGILVAVHVAMAAAVWPAVAAVLALRLRRGEPVRRVVVAAAVGLVAAALVAGIVAWRTADEPAGPPWQVGENPAIVRTFIRTTDPHRQPLPMPSAIGVVGPVAFALLAGVALAGGRRRPGRAAREGVVVLGALAWSCALGARAYQGLVGELPLPVAMAMPARFANLGMLLVLPLAVVALATAAPARLATVLATLLVATEAVLLVWAPRVAFVHLLYAALGVVAGAALGRTSRVPRRLALAGTAVLLVALAAVRTAEGGPVVWAFVAGLVPALTIAAVVAPAGRVAPPLGALAAAACLTVAVVAVRGPHAANAWDFGSERQTAEETSLAAWLRGNAPPRAMLLVAPFPPSWLAPKTGHPVLFDMITLLAMTYFPRQTEPVTRLVRDVFAIDYADPAALAPLLGPDGLLRPSSPVWLRTWPARSCEEWRAIGTRWGFDLVLAPHATRLRLESPWSGPTWTLYRIPARCDGVPS